MGQSLNKDPLYPLVQLGNPLSEVHASFQVHAVDLCVVRQHRGDNGEGKGVRTPA